MNKDLLFFHLYSCSKIALGKQYAAVYLLNRERIERIPIEVSVLIQELSKKTIGEVKEQYNNETVDQWVEYLWKNNIGFYVEDPRPFINAPIDYEKPSFIRRMQIEYSSSSPYDISSLSALIDLLLCKHIEIRLIGSVSLNLMNDILSCLRETCVRSIDLYVENTSNKKEDIISLLENHSKISSAIFFNAGYSYNHKYIYFVKESLDSIRNKPWPLDKYVVNFPFFSESMRYNTFYNKKIAIDSTGQIKNDLLLSEVFGVFPLDNPADIITNPCFTRFWNINVDLIEELKESEFRYAIYPAREITEIDGKYHIL